MLTLMGARGFAFNTNIYPLKTNSVRAVLCLVTQLCAALWDPVECRPLDSSVHGILQTRILEGVAFPFSRGSSERRDQTRILLHCW